MAAPFSGLGAARLKILAVLFAGVLMGALDIAIVGPALPAIQRAFDVDGRGLSWVFNAYILTGLASAPLMAKLSDRYGRRRVYLLDVSLFALGSLVVALSGSFHVLLAGRTIQAVGAGGIFPVASAVIGDSFPPERRGPALGLVGSVFGVAFLLGPLLGGVLLPWGWEWLFLVNLPVAAAVLWQASRVLPVSTPAEPRRPFDGAGALVLSAGLLALALALSGIDVAAFLASATSPRTLALLAAAAAAAPLFWVLEKHAADPVLPPELLRTRELRLVCLIAAGTGVAEAGMVFLPALAVAGLNVEESTASFMLLPLVAALLLGAPLAGWLLVRFGAKRIMQSGLILLTSGMVVLGAVTLTAGSFYLAGALAGVGLSALLGAPLRYVVIREVPESHRGAGQGVLTLFLSMGRIAGAAAVGGVAASRPEQVAGYQGAYLLVGAVLSAVVVWSVRLRPDAPVSGATPDRRAE